MRTIFTPPQTITNDTTMKQAISPPGRVPRAAQSRPLVIRLSMDEIAKAEQYAADEMRSRAAFLRLMILRGLQEYELQHGIKR